MGNPRSPTPRPPAIELRPGRPMNCCSSGRTRRGRGRITARLPPIIWVELDRPQGSGFHCRSYARGRALENVGGALPCLGFPLSGGAAQRWWGAALLLLPLLSPPPLTLTRGGGGARGRGGGLADDWPLGPPSRPPDNDSGDSRRRGRSHSGGEGATSYVAALSPPGSGSSIPRPPRSPPPGGQNTGRVPFPYSVPLRLFLVEHDLLGQEGHGHPAAPISRHPTHDSRKVEVGAQLRLEDPAVIVPLSTTCQSVIRRVLVARAAAVAPRRRLPPDATQVIPEAAYSGDHLCQAEGEPAIPARRPFTENGQKRPDNAALPMFWEGKPLEPFGFHALPGLSANISGPDLSLYYYHTQI